MGEKAKTQRVFLTAEWRKLVIANFLIDPSVLKKYLPYKTELDDWNGNHYVSIVGFMFLNTKVLGLSLPYHKNFEMNIDVMSIYGGEFVECLSAKPYSVLLAEGSEIVVRKGRVI